MNSAQLINSNPESLGFLPTPYGRAFLFAHPLAGWDPKFKNPVGGGRGG